MDETQQTRTPRELVQCQITGKLVPADEAVTIQGYRVSAEGKQQLLERLRAGEGLPGEMRRPTFLRRFGCWLLDMLILGAVSTVITLVTMMPFFIALVSSIAESNDPEALERRIEQEMLRYYGGQLVGGVLTTLIAVAYFTFMHGRLGQTLGKMAGRLRVVEMDGSTIEMRTAFHRALYYQLPAIANTVALTAVLVHLLIGQVVLFVVNLAALAFFLVNAILLVTDQSRQRALHDRWAGTRVIHEP